MTEQQYFLICFAEELGELTAELLRLQHLVSKASRFGVHNKWIHPDDLATQIQTEWNDVIGCLDALRDLGALQLFRDETLVATKRDKLKEFFQYAHSQGAITTHTPPPKGVRHMGYYMTFHEAELCLPHAQHIAALAALKSLVDTPLTWCHVQALRDTDSFLDALKACRWKAYTNPNGDIVNLEFLGQKLGDDLRIFSALAPFVLEGGYIEMHGEEGERWRWVFRDNHCIEIDPTITWD